MTTNNDQLRKMFWELHKLPSRVNRLDETQTDELVYFALNNTIGYKTDPVISEYNDISVLTNLLIHQNRQFSTKKLPETVIDHHLFHTAMLHTIVGKETPEQVAAMFTEMLTTWDKIKIGNLDERKIINTIVEYLTGKNTGNQIFIKNEYVRDQVVSDLSNYIEPFDRDKLADLLGGKTLQPEQIISYMGQINALVYLFRQLYETGCINNHLDKLVLKAWLIDNFKANDKILTIHTVWKYLTTSLPGRGETVYEKLLDQNNDKLIICPSLVK